MAIKKTGLGKPLDVLLGRPATPVAGAPVPAAVPVTPAAVPAAASTAPRDEELAKIPLDLLQRGQYQPRVDMRPDSLQELADSIRAQGVIQPVVVRPVGPSAPGTSQRYEIIAGERRWRAAQLAGLAEIPAVIRRVADDAAVAMALIENIQRENLNPLEEARALDRLISEFTMTHQEAAEAVGRSRVAVSNLLRLLELSDAVKTMVEHRELEMGHARALLGLTNRKQQAEVAALVAKKGLSVRETEGIVRGMIARGENSENSTASATPAVDPNVRKLQDDLSEKLGAKVVIQHGAKGKGKLIVAYNSLDELDGILEHIQ